MSSSSVLVWLNFFAADVRDGLGPFLGVFLKNQGFDEGQIGLLHTITHLFALSFSIPLGILVDSSTHKKALIACALLLIILFCSLNFFFPSFLFTLFAQSAIALSGAFLAPAFAALTLGIVGVRNYSMQCARNEAYKHGGTMFGAFCCMLFAWYFDIVAVFVITALLGCMSLCILHFIKAKDIDDNVACGLHKAQFQSQQSLREVFCNKAVLLMSFLLFCFHFSNAPMLPLLSQRAHTQGIDTSGIFAGASVFIAQGVMILSALFTGKILSKRKTSSNTNNVHSDVYFWLFCACFGALVMRGVLAAYFAGIGGMVITQILDGIGAGVTGVILPVFMAYALQGSGHINTALSCALTSGAIGGALSGGVAGALVVHFSYESAYLFLAFVACAGLCTLFLVRKNFQNTL